MIVLYTTERDYPWGTLRSTHASKTKVVLEEKRIRYRIENLRPGDLWKKPPEMLARHPLGKVPYIEDEGVTIFDSTVIDEYLDDRYGPPRLLPDEPLARAQVRQLEQFADEALLAGDLPPIWMAYWSDPDKRDVERMEKGREGLRHARSSVYRKGARRGARRRMSVRRLFDGRRADDGAGDGARSRPVGAGRISPRRALPQRIALAAELSRDKSSHQGRGGERAALNASARRLNAGASRR